MTDVTTARPWLDTSLPVDDRVQLLLDEMSIEEKAGLFFHTMIAIGDLDEANPVFATPSAREFVHVKNMTHFNLLGAAPTGREIAAWQNALQRLAADTRLGIPVTLSTDPRHSFSENPGASILAGPFSQWPETLGLAATRDPELVERFADIARQEYTAVGLRVALHPQVDLATESRWARQTATFGEDAELSGILGAAYIRGFQGASFGPGSVSTMTKHFPGGGPQKDGEDPHFPYGREQVYPGGQFELHLKPFEDALAAGTRQMMPYYGMPVGTEYEEVGFGFNRGVIAHLLREELGFDGVVCTDFGIITGYGEAFPAKAWGVEHLSVEERMLKVLDAGVDQFGGESGTDILRALVASGRITEQRLDVSARRLLREKFRLGQFDDARFVDEDAADSIIGASDHVAAGRRAQQASLTLLRNGDSATPVLPLDEGIRVYVDGVAPEAFRGRATVVASPEDADVAIIRVDSPSEVDPAAGFLGSMHMGSLDFTESVIDRVNGIAAIVPTVLDVFLERPAIVTPLRAQALLGSYGTDDDAFVEVLFGVAEPLGSLPFDLPRSMAAVEESREDVPFDTADPIFSFGHGLRYS